MATGAAAGALEQRHRIRRDRARAQQGRHLHEIDRPADFLVVLRVIKERLGHARNDRAGSDDKSTRRLKSPSRQ